MITLSQFDAASLNEVLPPHLVICRDEITETARPLSTRRLIAAFCAALGLLAAGSAVGARAVVQNLTGLPVYPDLSRAFMDKAAKTDTLGHWCTRFSAETPYPINQVVAWYRKALVRASETDLANDANYKSYLNLSGVKMALGVDYVTVFTMANRSATYIELFRCSHPG